MRARRIYEDIVYTHRDPALMEQMGASKVSMRIFPLFPKQDRRVLLAYTQPLARTYDDVTLTVPMPDLETPVAEVNMQVKVVGCGACEITSPSHRVQIQRDGADAIVRHQGVAETLGDSLRLLLRPAVPASCACASPTRRRCRWRRRSRTRSATRSCACAPPSTRPRPPASPRTARRSG